MRRVLRAKGKGDLTYKERKTCNIFMGKNAYVNSEPKRKIVAYSING